MELIDSWEPFSGSFKRHCVLSPNGRDVCNSWSWSERHHYTWEILAGLLHQHFEETERSQSTIKAVWHILLKQSLRFILSHFRYLFCCTAEVSYYLLDSLIHIFLTFCNCSCNYNTEHFAPTEHFCSCIIRLLPPLSPALSIGSYLHEVSQ